jgi:hypothetical protein
MISEAPDKLKGQKLGLFIFECVMSVLYLIVGAIFLFTPLINIQGEIRIGLGILLGVYGIFRVFRAIRKIILINR